MDYSVILPIQSIFHLYNQLYGTTTVVCCPMMLASWRGSLSYLYHPSEMQYDAVLHLGFLLVHLHKTLYNVHGSKCVAFYLKYLNCVQTLERIDELCLQLKTFSTSLKLHMIQRGEYSSLNGRICSMRKYWLWF